MRAIVRKTSVLGWSDGVACCIRKRLDSVCLMALAGIG
jgi:hypothetical protein